MRSSIITNGIWTTTLAIGLIASCGNLARADLLGYWSANSAAGAGSIIPNDQGNGDLDGELFGGAVYSADARGVTGQPGDYALSFPGEDADYAELPATEETFEEISITAWVNGIQAGDWAGIILSRDPAQPIGLDYHAFDGMINYLWNDNSAETWSFISDVLIPEDEWTFIALTVTEDAATLYAGSLGGELESAANEIVHFPQDNFTPWRLAEDDCCGEFRNFSGLIDDVSIWNEALSDDDLQSLFTLAATPLNLRGGITGDFDGSGALDLPDIDELTVESANGMNDPAYDLNGDSAVDEADIVVWVKELFNTWIGDADLDRSFTSGDLVTVLASGAYEADVDSSWSSGDFDGSGRTDSSDLVAALADGGYEVGPPPAVAAVVPEPSGAVLATIIPVYVLLVRRRLCITRR